MRPLQAVRRKCLWCCDDQLKEANLCPVVDCELFPFRFGKNPNKKRTLKLRDMRKYCLVCSSHSPKAVRECWDNNCALFPFRLGKNPNLVGKRGKSNCFSKKQRHHGAIFQYNFIISGLLQP